MAAFESAWRPPVRAEWFWFIEGLFLPALCFESVVKSQQNLKSSSNILETERRRSGAVLWDRNDMAKPETGAAYSMCAENMLTNPSPSPLQFAGQCVTSTLRWLRSGQQSSSAAPCSLLTDKTKTFQREKETSTAAVLKIAHHPPLISWSRILVSCLTLLQDFIIHSQHQILDFTYTGAELSSVCDRSPLKNWLAGPFRSDVLVMETFRAGLSTTQLYLLKTLNQ